jgi:hypothetical protein
MPYPDIPGDGSISDVFHVVVIGRGGNTNITKECSFHFFDANHHQEVPGRNSES